LGIYDIWGIKDIGYLGWTDFPISEGSLESVDIYFDNY
jgi:hypothetical protein